MILSVKGPVEFPVDVAIVRMKLSIASLGVEAAGVVAVRRANVRDEVDLIELGEIRNGMRAAVVLSFYIVLVR